MCMCMCVHCEHCFYLYTNAHTELHRGQMGAPQRGHQRLDGRENTNQSEVRGPNKNKGHLTEEGVLRWQTGTGNI